MPPKERKVNISAICKILELPLSSWTLAPNMTLEQAKESLKNFQDLIKKQRKGLAKKYHPDITGGDDSRIKQINDAVDAAMTIKIFERRPPQQVVMHFHSGNVFHGGSTTATNTDPFSNVRFYRY